MMHPYPGAAALLNSLSPVQNKLQIVYRNNIIPQKEHFDAIKLPEDKAKAIQPFAVRHDSPNRQLGQRLLAYLLKNRESFEQAGFTWKGDLKTIESAKIELPEWLKQK